jgi:putative spermidine/putrescine transport system substrate-binding protein
MWPRVLLRGFLVAFVICSMALIHGGFPGTAQGASDKKLVVQGWGGAKTEAETHAFFDPFTEETGIKIISVEAGADVWGKVAAQVRSGNIEWDLVSGYDYPSVEAAAQKGLLEEIDYGIVTRAKELVPGAARKWGLGQEINSICVGYNTKAFPGDKHPKSWADFFDTKKFPGPRAMNNFGAHVYNIFAALLADGVPPDALVPIDFDRAFKKLDQIKPHVKVWYTSGSQLSQILLDEEVVLASVFDGRAKVAKSLGAPIDFGWDQGMFLLCYWNVVKGAPHKEAAMRFLNFICRPEQQAVFTNYIGYSSANPKSVRYLHPSVHKDQAVYPENFKKQIDILTDKTAAWMAEHNDEINERWNAWLAK